MCRINFNVKKYDCIMSEVFCQEHNKTFKAEVLIGIFLER